LIALDYFSLLSLSLSKHPPTKVNPGNTYNNIDIDIDIGIFTKWFQRFLQQ